MASRREIDPEIWREIQEAAEAWKKQGVGEVMSLDGYFAHIRDRSYLPVHFEVGTVARDELLRGIVMEVGPGIGNDAEYLLRIIGVEPQNLILVEPDIFVAVDAMDRLEPIWGEQHLQENFLHASILESIFARYSAYYSAHVIYMNNTLHCIGSFPHGNEDSDIRSLAPEQRVQKAVRVVHEILVPGGIFFGRTLSTEVNAKKLEELRSRTNRTELEDFALKTALALKDGRLTGVDGEKLRRFVLCDVGFARGWVKPSPQVAGWSPVTDIYFRFEK